MDFLKALHLDAFWGSKRFLFIDWFGDSNNSKKTFQVKFLLIDLMTFFCLKSNLFCQFQNTSKEMRFYTQTTQLKWISISIKKQEKIEVNLKCEREMRAREEWERKKDTWSEINKKLCEITKKKWKKYKKLQRRAWNVEIVKSKKY